MLTGADAQDAHMHKPRVEADVAQGVVSISPHTFAVHCSVSNHLYKNLNPFMAHNQKKDETKHTKDYKVQSEPDGPYGSFPFSWL